jgi:hypothetical protein
MDNISAGIVGALIAIGGGVAFRVLEASNQRQHWFRDQMREAAERFLTDAQKHLDITWLNIIGELPDGSEAIRPPTSALEMDISRLQLVAPRPVNDVAADVFKKLRVAFNAAQMASSPFDEPRWTAANEAAEGASKRMADFADLVQQHLRRGFMPNLRRRL